MKQNLDKGNFRCDDYLDYFNIKEHIDIKIKIGFP